MSYTGSDIFAQAISIIDELSDTGIVNDAQVLEYKNRAPYLLDLWQKEIAKSGNLYNIQEYTNTDEDNICKWSKYSLPSGMKAIKDVLFLDDDSQFSTIEYKQFGNSDIYFYFRQTGTVRLLYVPIPVKITVLTQTLEVDDITATSGAYYLAEQFALSDQNTDLASICRAKYNELKQDTNTSLPMSPTQVIDVYNMGG